MKNGVNLDLVIITSVDKILPAIAGGHWMDFTL